MSDENRYTVENATRFAWSSVTGELNEDRIAFLKNHVVGANVLDAGCGGGGYCDFLARQGFDVLGIDLHEMYLELARQRFPSLTFQEADIAQLPFEDNRFETSFCFDVLEHVDDRAALREILRVTSKRVLLAVPHQGDEMFPYNLTFATYRDSTHQRYYTEQSLRELIVSLSPGANVVIAPELVLPTKQLLRHLCSATRCGYLGYGGMVLRLLKKLGFPCDAFATQRGARYLDKIAATTWNPIFTGLIAIVELP